MVAAERWIPACVGMTKYGAATTSFCEERTDEAALPAWHHGFEIFVEVLEVFKAHPALVGLGFHRAI
jgi:hypothetical protein